MTQIDMPMPERCADCPFACADLINGIITLACMTPVGRKMYAPDLISRKTRPEWCPLKEQEAIVRCKDCIYYLNTDKPKSLPCRITEKHPDWFCADGERRNSDA